MARGRFAGWLADRGVAVKSLFGVLLAGLVALTVGGVSISQLAELDDNIDTMKAHHVESLSALSAANAALSRTYRGMFLHNDSRSRGDAAMAAQGRQEVDAGDGQLADALARYARLSSPSPRRDEALATFTARMEYYQTLRDVLIFQEPAPAGFTMPPMDAVLNAFTSAEDDFNGALRELEGLENSQAEAMVNEAHSEYAQARTFTVATLLAGLLISFGAALWIVSIMRRQLRDTGTALTQLAEGDLTSTAVVRGRDELGQMADAVNRATAGIRGTVEALVTGARTLGDSAARLTGITGELDSSASQAAQRAGRGSSAAQEVSINVQTVAAGSEHMGSSIREIAQNANDAARVAADAVGVAQSTNRTVSKLGDSSAEIGNVVKVITSIAEQTNLLALNATIESARAGEAGKGFAVVANEVKELAQETARATEDISQRVEAIQADTANAVAAIGEISAIIGRINDYQLTIASAVEEQTSTTNEMSRSVSEAASGTSEIASNIAGVASSAQATTSSLADAGRTVAELSALAGELQAAVGRFRL